MELRSFIEGAAAVTMPVTVIGILLRAYLNKQYFGPHTIQFCAVAVLVPLILILALERILEAPTIGTLLGALIGYALSGRRLTPSSGQRSEGGGDEE